MNILKTIYSWVFRKPKQKIKRCDATDENDLDNSKHFVKVYSPRYHIEHNMSNGLIEIETKLLSLIISFLFTVNLA